MKDLSDFMYLELSGCGCAIAIGFLAGGVLLGMGLLGLFR